MPKVPFPEGYAYCKLCRKVKVYDDFSIMACEREEKEVICTHCYKGLNPVAA